MQRYRFHKEIQAMEAAEIAAKAWGPGNVLTAGKATNKANYLSRYTIRKPVTSETQKEAISLFAGKYTIANFNFFHFQ